MKGGSQQYQVPQGSCCVQKNWIGICYFAMTYGLTKIHCKPENAQTKYLGEMPPKIFRNPFRMMKGDQKRYLIWSNSRWFGKIPLHPGRLTWNIQITHLERKMIFQTSMIMFHVNLQGCIKPNHLDKLWREQNRLQSNPDPIQFLWIGGFWDVYFDEIVQMPGSWQNL